MLALAEPPHTQPDHTPGLKHSPEWHREQEDKERAWLDAYNRWCNKFRALPAHDDGGSR
jgi:hypothetical protein